MENDIQEMTSLSDYHWLFADELAPGDAHFPTFVPRVLNFEKSSNHSHDSTSALTSPSLNQDESRVPVSPIYRPEDELEPSWVTNGSEFSTRLSSATLSKRGCLSSPQFASNTQSCGLKRRNDYYHDEYPRKRRQPQSPVYDPNYTFDEGAYRPPSPVFIASIASSPLVHLDKPKIHPSLTSWYRPDQLQQSSRDVPRFNQEAINHDGDDDNLKILNESKRCIKFLVEEMSKVIEVDRFYGNNSEITRRTIKRTEDRLKSFIQTSQIMSQIITSAHDMSNEPYDSITEDTMHPFLYSGDTHDPLAGFNLPNPFLSMSRCSATVPLPDTHDCALMTHGEASSIRSEIPSNNYTAFTNAAIHNHLSTSLLVDSSNRPCSSSQNHSPPNELLPVPHFLTNFLHYQSSLHLVDHNFHSIRNILI